MSDSDSQSLPEARRVLGIEEEDSAPDPTLAADDFNEDGVPNDGDSDDDLESLLSEVDEAQFEDFDPSAVALADRSAIPIDESNVRLLGVHKRKRGEGETEEARRKKRREGKREKPKRSRRRRDGSEPFSGGEELDGKRSRKPRAEPSERRRAVPEVDEESLTPEERRKRALDRAMDEALRNPNARRRRQGGIDLDAMADQEIEEMRNRMTKAAEMDTEARINGQPAMHKLKMLPEVVSLLNRNTLANQLVDPDINLLEAVRFFLEPLNDGSLPAYNIQRELFASLAKLPITKDTLVASGIGKVVLFYTRSSKVEANIKRQAEKLVTEWMRPILKRTDDYRKREVETAAYDRSRGPSSTQTNQSKLDMARERALQMPILGNRARMETGVANYSIAPRSNVNAGPKLKQPGQSGDAMVRRLKMKQTGKTR